MSAVAEKIAPPPGWGVEVNENGIFANRAGAEWWAQAIAPWELSGRATALWLGPQGGIWWLPCADKEEAEFARDHITSHGVHPKFVKARRQRP